MIDEEENEKELPPTIVGTEQQKLYDELDELKEFAPERNELQHIKHLNDYWFEAAREDIQDKMYHQKVFRGHLEHE